MISKTLFMTGPNGFLGKRFLKEVAGEAMDIVLLVQEKFKADMETFISTLQAQPSTQAHFHSLIGDITLPGLGLSEATTQHLRETVTHALHLAAAYDLTLNREIGHRVNVMGTENVLKFLRPLKRLQSFLYLSTTAISGTHRGFFAETDFDVGQRFKNYYEETKFEAEKKVREVRGEIPTVIIRPTIIVGDSRTGEMEKIDGPYYAFRMIARKMHVMIQSAPGVKCNVEPVDFVIAGIRALLEKPSAVGKTIHLADPHPLDYDSFFDLVFSHWPTFKPLLRLPAAAMYPFFFIPGFGRIIGVPRQSYVYTMTSVEYGTEEMTRQLAGTGVHCPAVAEYIEVMIRYFQERGKTSVRQGARW